jgi:LysR family transcriptional regulator, hydrogen peroxide-inducible genes activator
MNLHQVRYFLALCEEQHFSRAARRCGISQPSLTNAIHALEQELGGLLFHRKPRITSTRLGRLLRPHFKAVVNAVDKVRTVAADANGFGPRRRYQPPARSCDALTPIRTSSRNGDASPRAQDGG